MMRLASSRALGELPPVSRELLSASTRVDSAFSISPWIFCARSSSIVLTRGKTHFHT